MTYIKFLSIKKQLRTFPPNHSITKKRRFPPAVLNGHQKVFSCKEPQVQHQIKNLVFAGMMEDCLFDSPLVVDCLCLSKNSFFNTEIVAQVEVFMPLVSYI